MGKFTLPFANVNGLTECLIFVCEVNHKQIWLLGRFR